MVIHTFLAGLLSNLPGGLVKHSTRIRALGSDAGRTRPLLLELDESRGFEGLKPDSTVRVTIIIYTCLQINKKASLLAFLPPSRPLLPCCAVVLAQCPPMDFSEEFHYQGPSPALSPNGLYVASTSNKKYVTTVPQIDSPFRDCSHPIPPRVLTDFSLPPLNTSYPRRLIIRHVDTLATIQEYKCIDVVSQSKLPFLGHLKTSRFLISNLPSLPPSHP